MKFAILLWMLAYNGQACDTLGFSNHNPGNLSAGMRHWQSAVGVDAWGHLKFPDDRTGLRAIYQTLKTYRRRYHIHSIEHLCGRWTAPTTSILERRSWIRTVLQRTHTKPGQRLIFDDPQMAESIARGIVWAENSCDPYTDSDYKAVFH